MEPEKELQRAFWNKWNSENRQHDLGEISHRQARVVEDWLVELGRRDLKILEAGCGKGWFCPTLAKYGDVTGTDISDEVLSAARSRWPHIEFVAGDFTKLEFAPMSYDVIVSLEVLSHVADQEKFFERLADLLKPGGHLFLATQNRPVLQHYCNCAEAASRANSSVGRPQRADCSCKQALPLPTNTSGGCSPPARSIA